MNILGVITARGGSKGISGKNIKMLGGKPLMAYTIEAAKKSKHITHLIVSTDDGHIARIARDYGADVPFMRPEELAQDTTAHVPVTQHALRFMEEKLGLTFDFAVILQPTSPFRTPEDIDATLEKLISSDADSAVSLVEVPSSEHPVKMKKLENGKVFPYCIPEIEGTRRQDMPLAYKRSGAVYAMKRDILMKGHLYGKYVVGHIVPRERSIDIDYPFDWIKAEYMFEQLKKNGYAF